MKFLPFLVLLILIPVSVYATHENQSTECSISINSEILPITYITQERNNPNGSFYPGDGFHYLFTFTGIPECISFDVNEVISEGIFDVISHNSIMWNTNTETEHSHYISDVVPKYLKTISYYYVTDNHLGYSVSENPSFSYREDEELSDFSQGHLDSIKEHSSNYIREDTYDWALVNSNVIHENGDLLHQNESDESIESFENYIESTCSNLEQYSGCVFGHVELDTEIITEKCLFEELEKIQVSYADIENDECISIDHILSLSIQGTKRFCYYEDNQEICEIVLVEKTKHIEPNILSTEFEIILSDPPVKDRDNYDGKNKDDTYYPHDPIGIIHNPSLLWKDYRSETIQFETTKKYDLTNEYEYDCNSNECDHKIGLSSVYPALYSFGNGEGITVYNGTTNDFGLHDFEYSMIMTNLDRQMYTANNTINIKIVDYFPQYKSYPYPLLKDNQELAFDDRQGVALYYFGSVEGEEIYEKRRSKINSVYNIGVGYDPFTPQIIIQNFTLHEGITVSKDVLLSHNQTAVFTQSGYGKIYFEYPLSEIIIPDGIPKFENVTSYTTLFSVDFAAKDTLVEFYSMRYPEASFTKNLVIKSVNQNGTIMDNDIQVELIPYEKINTEYITNYIYDKIKFDSDDETFAKIISDDTYSMTQEYSNIGMINTTISKTSVFFDEYVEQINNVNATFTESVISDLTSLLDESDTIRLLAPYDLGLSALSPTTLYITVNDITNTIDGRYYSFGGKQTIIINTQIDNILYADRDKNTIVIYPPENFGLIETVYINEIIIEQKCQNGCVISYPPENQITLFVHNKWKGIASVLLPEITIPIIPITDEPNYMMILAIVILLMLIYIGYKKIRLN